MKRKLKTLDKIVNENQICIVSNGMPIRKNHLEKLGTEVNVTKHEKYNDILIYNGLWFHKSWFESTEVDNERK